MTEAVGDAERVALERERHKASIFVGVPHNGFMHPRTGCCLALAAAVTVKIGHDFQIAEQPGPYVHWNREQIVEHAILVDAEKVVFLDCDLTFPPETFAQLAAHDADVVGVIYHMKQHDPRVANVRLHDPERPGQYLADANLSDHVPDGLFRVAAIGTGLMCIDTTAIQLVPRPWFPCDYGDGSRAGGAVGEDIAFCQKAERAGLEVWCDPNLPVGHIGEHTY